MVVGLGNGGLGYLEQSMSLDKKFISGSNLVPNLYNSGLMLILVLLQLEFGSDWASLNK